MRGGVLALIVALAAWLVQAQSLARLEALRQDAPDHLIVPPSAVMRLVVTDFSNLTADLFWLEALVYNGDQLTRTSGERDFGGLYPAFDLVGTLDPRFAEATLYGSWALGDAGRSTEACELLRKAMARDPREWQYPYQLGFIEFLYARQYAAAAEHFMRASQLPGAPANSPRLAAAMYARGNKKDLAVATWRAVYAHGDAYLQGVARRSLAKLGSPLPE